MEFNRVEFEITHLCNKMCKMCSHRISTSNYKYLTIKDLKYLLSCFTEPDKIKKVLIIGGEPLCHPKFEEIINQIKLKFQKARVIIQTNGSNLLDYVSKHVFNELFWKISAYPSWNDEIIEKYKNFKNVSIMEFNGWYDPYQDPNLDEKTAKLIAKICLHEVRIIGTNLYRCCLSEGVERYYKTESVHIKMSKTWKRDWEKLPVWKACQHCYYAIEGNNITSKKRYGARLSHNNQKIPKLIFILQNNLPHNFFTDKSIYILNNAFITYKRITRKA